MRTFLEGLKGYLRNIEAKRDFLRKLRKEFAVKSFRVEEGLRRLTHSNLNESQVNIVKGLFKHWKEVE